jgi:hypothetical protein
MTHRAAVCTGRAGGRSPALSSDCVIAPDGAGLAGTTYLEHVKSWRLLVLPVAAMVATGSAVGLAASSGYSATTRYIAAESLLAFTNCCAGDPDREVVRSWPATTPPTGGHSVTRHDERR